MTTIFQQLQNIQNKSTVFGNIDNGGDQDILVEIGLGSATKVDSIIINWVKENSTQFFTNVEINNHYSVKETIDTIQKNKFQKFNYNAMKLMNCH